MQIWELLTDDVNEGLTYLSHSDPKDTLQKFLKLGEEVGELSEAIQAAGSIAGSAHKLKTNVDVLEEAIDCFLVISSIIETSEVPSTTIDNILRAKLDKWKQIQRNESNPKPLFFEVHLTVDVDNDDHLTKFKQVCGDLGVKPIIVDLQNGDDSNKDVMTSSVHNGNNKTVMEYTSMLSDELSKAGFVVTRHKVETVPWHPAAVQQTDTVEDKYFETHIPLIMTPTCDTTLLNVICDTFDLHKSKNPFKTMDDGTYKQMLTLRKYNCSYEVFVQHKHEALIELKQHFTVEKDPDDEYALYDSNVKHDSKWMSPE